jgi:hypothetical protein
LLVFPGLVLIVLSAALYSGAALLRWHRRRRTWTNS